MASCEHPAAERFRVCRHLLDRPGDVDHVVRFTGHGLDCEYACRACVEAPELALVCGACRDAATGSWDGIVGAPEIAIEPSELAIAHTRVALALPAFTDVQPVLGTERSVWIGVTADGDLHRFDVERRTMQLVGRVPEPLDAPILRLSRDGTLAAVAERTGVRGVVLDLAAQRVLMPLARDGYHAEHTRFPIAFVERGGRSLVVCSPAWNRLDMIDPRTGEVLTPRPTPGNGEPHDLDYFHCGLTVSPDQRWIVDNGWVWAPVGSITAWSIDRWFDNAWESEDGPSRREVCWRHYYWDGPLCWLDGTQLAVYGYGLDDEWLIPAVRIFDVATGSELRWFPGPRGELAFDRELYASDGEATTVWNLARGSRLLHAPALRDARYHPSAKALLSLTDGVTHAVVRGAAAALRRGVVADLARRIARERCFDELPVLGDALEAAGCADADLLAHCQRPGPHDDRCWVLDRLAAE